MVATRRAFAAAAIAASLGLLASAPIAAAAPPKPVRVVIFGDSSSAPRGNIRIYADSLRDELRNVEIVDAAVAGDTTATARRRFETDVRQHDPDVVVIQFGINDAAVDVWKQPPAMQPRVPVDESRGNLKFFLDALGADGAHVILMTSPPLRWTPKLRELYGRPPYAPAAVDGLDRPLAAYRAAAAALAREEHVDLIDLPAAFSAEADRIDAPVDTLLSEGMFPNDRGHRVMADLVRERLLALARTHGLAIAEGPRWKRSGDNVFIHPLATDVTHDTRHPSVLGSGLGRLRDGRMMSVYSAPTSCYGKPGSTWIAARVTADGGGSWAPETIVARHPDCQPCHPAVLVTRDGAIHVFYLGFKTWKWKDGNPTADTVSDLWTTRSRDDGATWSPPQRIFQGYSGATNGGLETSGGTIVVPFSHYARDPGRLVSRTAVSRNGGETWELAAAVDIGGAGDHEGALEPTVFERRDGAVQMLIRTTRGVFWEATSTAGERGWSPAVAGTVDATSAPAHVCRLADGGLVMAWNRRARARKDLHVAISCDDGATWGPSVLVATGHSATYPFVIERSPGELWIGYHDVARGWNFPRARHLAVRTADLFGSPPVP